MAQNETYHAARQAEAALLSSLLIEGASKTEGIIDDIKGIVEPSDFLDSGFPDNQHTRIYEAILKCHYPDPITVARQMNTDGTLQKGDATYLRQIVAEAQGIDHVAYAEAIADYANKRRNGGPAEPTPVPFGFGLTDLGNAERLIRQFGDRLHYCYERKHWLIWHDKVWEWDSGAKIASLAKLAVRNIYHEAADEPDDKERNNLANHAKNSESDHRINAMISLAQSESGIPVKATELDVNPWLFNCLNGTLDLKSGQLQPHSKDDLLAVIVPVEYNADAKCPIWAKFLDRVTGGDIDLQNYLQRAVGYSLTGDTKNQVIFLFYGLGNNGKSTFTMTIRKLMSGYGKRLEADDLMLKDRNMGGGPKEGIANLKNKRYVVGSELQDGRRLDTSLVKDMTGGETIKGRRLYEHEVEYMPTFKLWLYGNHKPKIDDSTLSIWRRVKEIPFNVTIPDKEIDMDLPSKLEAELPGILAWAVEGCLEWQKHGLKEPTAVTTATDSYRRESDILGDFIEDCCILEPLATIPKSDLKAEYLKWCENNGIEPVKQRTFKVRLIEKGVVEGRIDKARYWRGIRLWVDADGDILNDKNDKNDKTLDGSGTKMTRVMDLPESPLREGKQKDFTAEPVSDVIQAQKPVKNVIKEPDYPANPCPSCGGDYWLRPKGPGGPAQWLCKKCHPEPKGGDGQ